MTEQEHRALAVKTAAALCFYTDFLLEHVQMQMCMGENQYYSAGSCPSSQS